MARRDCIIVDIDGCLANNMHRQHHMPHDRATFFGSMDKDTPFAHVVHLCHSYYALKGSLRTHVFLCTGRSDEWARTTHAWLAAFDVRFDELMQRKQGDTRADSIVKLDMLNHIRKRGFNVIFAVDDRPECINMFRLNNVPVLECDRSIWETKPADYDKDMKIRELTHENEQLRGLLAKLPVPQ